MIVGLVKERFLDLKVLVVPDYVDKIKQLGVIVKRSQRFGSGTHCDH